jgi:hypothetical protein
VSPAVTLLHPDAAAMFKDSYLVDFPGLPEAHSEQDLRSMNSNPNIWGSWNSISRLSIATYASHTVGACPFSIAQ